jgi:hypothetical protein
MLRARRTAATAAHLELAVREPHDLVAACVAIALQSL